jgi:glycosyltransferase involved in cell wall biosynthesis
VIRELRPDVVHLHTQTAHPADVCGAVPAVMTIHGAVRGPDSSTAGLAGAARQASVVAISRSQLSSAPQVRWAGMVHNGIDLRRYPCGGRREDSQGAVLYLGRISPHKGTDLAIDAARAAGRRLIIAGGWTIPEEREYFNAAIRPRLGEDVVWLGEVGFEQKVGLLSRAACLLFPARWREPFGLVLIEAMACGTPVVALRSGAVPELVIDGETGILCGSPAELPAAIQEAGGLETRRCRAHVERYFSAAGMVAGYADIYRRRCRPAGSPAADTLKAGP